MLDTMKYLFLDISLALLVSLKNDPGTASLKDNNTAFSTTGILTTGTTLAEGRVSFPSWLSVEGKSQEVKKDTESSASALLSLPHFRQKKP